MNRRQVLTLIGSSAALALAGCANLVDDEDDDTDGQPALSGSVAGRTATVSDVEQSVAAELDVAATLEIDPAYVRVRESGTVEILTDELSGTELRDALTDAGYEVQDTTDGLTEQTREAIVGALQGQLDAADIDGEVHFEDGSVVIETDEDVAEDLTTEPETVAIELSYPSAESGEQRRETVLTGADIAEVPGVQTGSGSGPRVQVHLTESAGERFATRLVETGFTEHTEQAACEFDPDNEDDPAAGQYCILTATDGEVVHAASLNADLANTMEEGAFEADPAFVVTTAEDEEEAEKLAEVLRAGVPPASVEFEQ